MVLTANEEKNSSYVFTKRIEFSVKGATETDFVEMREFNMQEAKQFQQAAQMQGDEMANPVAAIEKAEQFFSGCIVDSSFTNEDGSKCSGKQIYDYLKKSSQLFQLILTQWLRSDDSPFQLITQSGKN